MSAEAITKKINRLQKKLDKQLLTVTEPKDKAKIEKKIKLLLKAEKVFISEETKTKYIVKLAETIKVKDSKLLKPNEEENLKFVETTDDIVFEEEPNLTINSTDDIFREAPIKKTKVSKVKIARQIIKEKTLITQQIVKQKAIATKEYIQKRTFEQWLKFIGYYLIIANILSLLSFLYITPFTFLSISMFVAHLFCAYLFFKQKTIFPHIYRLFMIANFILVDIIFLPYSGFYCIFSIVAFLSYFAMFIQLSKKQKTKEYFVNSLENEKVFIANTFKKVIPKNQ